MNNIYLLISIMICGCIFASEQQAGSRTSVIEGLPDSEKKRVFCNRVTFSSKQPWRMLISRMKAERTCFQCNGTSGGFQGIASTGERTQFYCFRTYYINGKTISDKYEQGDHDICASFSCEPFKDVYTLNSGSAGYMSVRLVRDDDGSGIELICHKRGGGTGSVDTSVMRIIALTYHHHFIYELFNGDAVQKITVSPDCAKSYINDVGAWMTGDATGVLIVPFQYAGYYGDQRCRFHKQNVPKSSNKEGSCSSSSSSSSSISSTSSSLSAVSSTRES